MRLLKFEIENLRSVKQQELVACGNFNVLIGKNNSGKSNILGAIAEFFVFLSRDILATSSNSPFRSDDDYFERNTSKNIRVRASIGMDEEDLRVMFAEIGSEFPQVQQALPQVGPFDYLVVEVHFLRKPSTLAYLHSVYYQACDPVTGKINSESRMLLEVSGDAAVELATRELEIETLSADIRAINSRRQDPDSFKMIKREPSYTSIIFRGDLSRQRLREVQMAAAEAENSTKFTEMIDGKHSVIP